MLAGRTGETIPLGHLQRHRDKCHLACFGEAVHRGAAQEGMESTRARGLMHLWIDPLLRKVFHAIAERPHRCFQQRRAFSSCGHRGPEVTTERTDQPLVHALQGVLVVVHVAFLALSGLGEPGDIMCSDDQEGRTGVIALTGEMQILDRVFVGPPGADDLCVVRLGIRPTQPGGAGKSPSVNLSPR